MEMFVKRINDELDRRGWSRAEAARRGRVSDSMFSKVISGYANPGLDFCRGVARAFDWPLEDVFRLAGILPTRNSQPANPPPATRFSDHRLTYRVRGDTDDERLIGLYHDLGPEDRELLLAFALGD